jgi:hypothetical protein
LGRRFLNLFENSVRVKWAKTSFSPSGFDDARGQCRTPRLVIKQNEMLLSDYTCTFAVQLFHMFTISGLGRSKHSDIAWLKLVGCVRRKAAENDVLITKLQGFIRHESIIYQDPQPMICAMFSLRIKHLMIPI